MGTDFVIGSAGEGGGLRKARDLPEGTAIRVESVEPMETQYTVKIKNGPKAGQEVPKWQLKAVFEVLEDVDAGDMGDSEDVEAGELFVQYYGGVYPRDDGSIFISDAGGAAGFIERMADAGVVTKSWDDFADAEGIIELERGRTGFGPYVIAYLASEDEAPPKKAKAKKAKKSTKAKAKPKKATKAKKAKGKKKSAFDALDEEDQEAVLEAVAEGLDTADDLVNAEIATDEEHAEEILATVPDQE